MITFVGAYAIVKASPIEREVQFRRCSTWPILHQSQGMSWKFCPNCGSPITTVTEKRYIRKSLWEIEQQGLLPSGKYISVPYEVNEDVVDEWHNFPLIIIVDDQETHLRHEGGLTPADIITNISAEDITRCTSNFIRLYFKELRELGETTVHFGALDVGN